MKRSLGEKTFGVFNIILMLLLSAIMLYPYLKFNAASTVTVSFTMLTVTPFESDLIPNLLINSLVAFPAIAPAYMVAELFMKQQ